MKKSMIGALTFVVAIFTASCDQSPLPKDSEKRPTETSREYYRILRHADSEIGDLMSDTREIQTMFKEDASKRRITRKITHLQDQLKKAEVAYKEVEPVVDSLDAEDFGLYQRLGSYLEDEKEEIGDFELKIEEL